MHSKGFLRNKDLIHKQSVKKTVENFLSVIHQKNPTINAFIEVFEEEALARSEEIDRKISNGTAGKLAGLVIAIKDNICYKDHKVSASSKMLENFESLFSATVVERLLNEDAIIIGRTGCDEFAMGSSSETSYYGKIRNPLNPDKTPGGSSGGSAAAVAAGMCHASLGSDTGGSIRQPASFCGLVGVKPTYGRVSRWGLIAYASSFDQIGPICHSIDDAALILETISGPDDFDATVSNRAVGNFMPGDNTPAKKLLWIPQLLELDALNEEVKQNYLNVIDAWKSSGGIVEEVNFEWFDYLVPAYYILTTAEASSNLARYDGIHFGYRSPNAGNLNETYVKSRSEGFGFEVKRRILLGTFVLSAGYYDAYYARAQKARRMFKEKLDGYLGTDNILVLPTTPHGAFDLDSIQDPIQMYLEDIFTVLANLTGHPAMSVTSGKNQENMPFGIQLIGPAFHEGMLFATAQLLYKSMHREA